MKNKLYEKSLFLKIPIFNHVFIDNHLLSIKEINKKDFKISKLKINKSNLAKNLNNFHKA